MDKNIGEVIQKKAVVLVSGGLDSATVLAMAKDEGYACYALSFDYGQRHSHELLQSKKVAKLLGAEQHKIANIDLGVFGGSALTDEGIDVPEQEEDGIPVTYVPARNTVFLSMALGWAEVLGANAIFIGANAVDYSGYPDCRPEYIESFEKMANLATKQSVEGVPFKIYAPLIHLSKADIIRQGIRLGVDYGITSSCYNPKDDGMPCEVCDSCRIRSAGFKAAGIGDPLLAQC
ncbi:MAG: 7-cyano-7-deazaguanine synthase QueC [Arenicella sp.]